MSYRVSQTHTVTTSRDQPLTFEKVHSGEESQSECQRRYAEMDAMNRKMTWRGQFWFLSTDRCELFVGRGKEK